MPRAAEGCLATMFHGNGFGFGPSGVYLPSAMQRQAMWRAQSDRLADTVKLGMLVGEYMPRAYGGRYYGRAQNLARLLSDSYDQALRGSIFWRRRRSLSRRLDGRRRTRRAKKWWVRLSA